MQIRRDRIRLRYNAEGDYWELVHLGMGDEDDRVVAAFYTGRATHPGDLAYWAFEHVCVSERA